MKPNQVNFCSGDAYPGWLEVMLLPECNGKCSWCIEKIGIHPEHRESWDKIAWAAVDSGAKHVILLGGEPTLYKEIQKVITILTVHGIKVYVTTNGKKLTGKYVKDNLKGLEGINISIHNYDFNRNCLITGLTLNHFDLSEAVETLKEQDTKVRFNCNCIKGHIDSMKEIEAYVEFAKKYGADDVRFAELKLDGDNFVNISKMFDYQHGLSEDPFTNGCVFNIVINDMPVNLRIMCGLQTEVRKMPVNPEQVGKKVLYYDGKIYDGWQQQGETSMTAKEKKEMVKLVKAVKAGKMSAEDFVAWVDKKEEKGNKLRDAISSSHCRY